jgi:hypothetical protein
MDPLLKGLGYRNHQFQRLLFPLLVLLLLLLA